MAVRDPHLIAARIVREAGGELIGRTRLQKVVYLTQLAGFSDEFQFECRRHGPFSQDLEDGMEIASALGAVTEQEKRADWGGWYSVYNTSGEPAPGVEERSAFIRRAKQIGAIELELAATAAFLFTRYRSNDPWLETARCKPQKAGDGRLGRARSDYARLRDETQPNKLPLLGGSPSAASEC